MPQFWKKWKYPYLSAVGVSIVIGIYLLSNPNFKNWLSGLGSLEYLGALLAGILFTSSFTVAISIAIFAILAQNIHPLALGLIGGVGSVVGDLVVFKLVRDHMSEELTLLFGKAGTSYVKQVLKSKYISWTLPVIGAFIIASPLPDELGVSLLGISKMSESKFIAISYTFNALGILMIASVAKVF